MAWGLVRKHPFGSRVDLSLSLRVGEAGYTNSVSSITYNITYRPMYKIDFIFRKCFLFHFQIKNRVQT